MKSFKYFVFLVLSCVSISNIWAGVFSRPEGLLEKKVGNKVESKDKKNNPDACQCYCSDKCGPRDKGGRVDDNPTFNEEHGKCFCQKRDLDNYDTKKHPEYDGRTCKEQEAIESSDEKFKTNCCSKE